MVGEGVRLVVHARPKSSREGLESTPEDVLVIKISAPPADGQANARVEAVLASLLGVPRRDVRITRGETSRQKELEVLGLSLDEVRARLSPSVTSARPT